MSEIEDWIRERLNSGYSPDEIKEKLERSTHFSPGLVDDVIEDSDFTYEIQNDDIDIRNWIREQLNSGYSPEELKQSLKNNDYSPELVDEILAEREQKTSEEINTEKPESNYKDKVVENDSKRSRFPWKKFAVLIMSTALIVLVSYFVYIELIDLFPSEYSDIRSYEDCVEVYDWYDLKQISDDLYDNYCLMNDLDETVDGYDEIIEDGWINIGSYHLGLSFNGTFDGNGYTISGLHNYDGASDNNIGFIRYNTGNIIDLNLADVNITGDLKVGGLVGYNDGNILNTSVDGTVTGEEKVGGLVGYNDGEIIQSNSSVDVIGDLKVGGLVGLNNDGEIQVSVSDSQVSGLDEVGGLVGLQRLGSLINKSSSFGEVNILDENTINQIAGGLVGWASGDIINSYSETDVNGIDFAGGLVGIFNEGLIESSYSTGDAIGEFVSGGFVGVNGGTINNSYTLSSIEAEEAGGFVGRNGGTINNSYTLSSIEAEEAGGFIFRNTIEHDGDILEGSIFNSYWNINELDTDYSAGGTGISDEEMMSKSTFIDAGWDFEDVWYMEEYPELQWNNR